MAATADWVEVNIVPSGGEHPEALLLEVVDPLVHDRLREHIRTWFFFWEPELRLRVRWREPIRSAANRSELGRWLDQARDAGKLERWWEGSHGRRGETYTGEADYYGEAVWELTANDWMSGSELALALIKLEHDGLPGKPRSFHWQRRVHLFSNQLRADEISLCLQQAQGYIGLYHRNDPRFADLIRAIEGTFRP